MNKYFTAQEVAERLKVKKTTVYELIKRGELPSSKIGKQLRISEEQLECYLKGSNSASLPQPPSYQPESSILKRDYLLKTNGFIISGQDSSALELLCSMLSHNDEGFPVLQSHLNTYNGLYALYFGKVHIASAAGLTLEDIQPLLPGMSLEVIHLYNYREGFFFPKDNPKNIANIQDIKRSDIILANREKGSSRRIHLDQLLKKHHISPVEISGYKKEYVSDIAAASAVSRRLADIFLGEEGIARQFPDLRFLPIASYPMYLIYPRELSEHPGILTLKKAVASDEFIENLRAQTDYDTTQTGSYFLL